MSLRLLLRVINWESPKIEFCYQERNLFSSPNFDPDLVAEELY